jgi:hypothetical protein
MFSNPNKIYGIPEGVSYGQNDRVDELNDRISARGVSDYALPSNFDPRPTQTRFTMFPALDSRRPVNTQIESNYDYAAETNFTPPIGGRGPVSGFLNHVDAESNLRNQFFALQKGAGQGVYIPSSKSDLYRVTVPHIPGEQTHPLLFERTQFDSRLHPNIVSAPAVGKDVFNKYTRFQLRDLEPSQDVEP